MAKQKMDVHVEAHGAGEGSSTSFRADFASSLSLGLWAATFPPPAHIDVAVTERDGLFASGNVPAAALEALHDNEVFGNAVERGYGVRITDTAVTVIVPRQLGADVTRQVAAVAATLRHQLEPQLSAISEIRLARIDAQLRVRVGASAAADVARSLRRLGDALGFEHDKDTLRGEVRTAETYRTASRVPVVLRATRARGRDRWELSMPCAVGPSHRIEFRAPARNRAMLKLSGAQPLTPRDPDLAARFVFLNVDAMSLDALLTPALCRQLLALPAIVETGQLRDGRLRLETSTLIDDIDVVTDLLNHGATLARVLAGLPLG